MQQVHNKSNRCKFMRNKMLTVLVSCSAGAAVRCGESVSRGQQRHYRCLATRSRDRRKWRHLRTRIGRRQRRTVSRWYRLRLLHFIIITLPKVIWEQMHCRERAEFSEGGGENLHTITPDHVCCQPIRTLFDIRAGKSGRHLKNYPCRGGSGPQSNSLCGSLVHKSRHLNNISISSAVLQGSRSWSADKHTHPRLSAQLIVCWVLTLLIMYTKLK